MKNALKLYNSLCLFLFFPPPLACHMKSASKLGSNENFALLRRALHVLISDRAGKYESSWAATAQNSQMLLINTFADVQHLEKLLFFFF